MPRDAARAMGIHVASPTRDRYPLAGRDRNLPAAIDTKPPRARAPAASSQAQKPSPRRFLETSPAPAAAQQPGSSRRRPMVPAPHRRDRATRVRSECAARPSREYRCRWRPPSARRDETLPRSPARASRPAPVRAAARFPIPRRAEVPCAATSPRRRRPAIATRTRSLNRPARSYPARKRRGPALPPPRPRAPPAESSPAQRRARAQTPG